MKLVIAGDWHSAVHEQPMQEALASLGHEVHPFGWHRYFESRRLVDRIQNKYLFGPKIDQMNRDLADAVRALRPDVLFVYRGTHVTKATLQAIKAACPSTVLVGYNNDDPFSPTQSPRLWRHFLGAIPHYDLLLAYRHQNLADFSQAGARRVRLLRSWFVPQFHHPTPLTDGDRAEYGADVVFVGHHEPDGRVEMLEALARQGVRLRIFGPDKGFGVYGWHAALARSAALRHLAPTRLVWGADYAKALSGARIALAFFSKLNRDTYTRRCFEIPAVGTFMLAEYSDDLASMFAEGREAEFFRSGAEFVEKTMTYLKDDRSRIAIADAGHRRVIADGHDVVSRMRLLVDWTREILAEAA